MSVALASTSTRGTTGGSIVGMGLNMLLRATGTRGTTGGAVVGSAVSFLLRATSTRGGTGGSIVGTARSMLLRATSTRGGTGGAIVGSIVTRTRNGELQAALNGTTRRAALSVTGAGMTVQDVVQHLLHLWGRSTCADCSDSDVQRDAMACVNHALQTLYSHAPRLDWFSRESVSLTITGGTGSTTLAQGVQTVLGNVRLSDNGDILPLIECRSRAEFDAYLTVAYGGAAYAPELPRAYWLESLRQTAEDGVALTLHVTPEPADNATVLLDVVKEPERYQWHHARNGTRLRVPHRYVESLLLPVALKWASRYRHFTRREMQPQIDEGYATALAALGLTTTETPAKQAAEPSDTPKPKAHA